MATSDSSSTSSTLVIQVITWFSLAAVLFSLAARAVTKFVIVKIVSLDDYLIALSVVFAVGQIASVTVQTFHGLGQPHGTFSASDVDIVLKAQYAADLVHIFSLCLAKSAVLHFIYIISPVRQHRRIVRLFQAVIVLWALSSIFAVSFECPLPYTWDFVRQSCLHRRAWWNSFGVIDVITDVALILLPAYIIRNVQTSVKKKTTVILYFGVRTCVIAAEICRVVFWNRLEGTADPILDLWPVVLCTEIIQCTSIMAACSLYLRPFLELLQSGFFNLDDLIRKGDAGALTLAPAAQSAACSVVREIGNLPDYEEVEDEMPEDIHSNARPRIFRGRFGDSSRSPSDTNGTRRWFVE